MPCYVRGDTLADVIRRFHESGAASQKRDWHGVAFRKLVGQLLDVCNVIAYAHSKGVIHRDLKPRNVMLGPFGETLVLDWGMAKELRPCGPDPEHEDGPLFAPESSECAGTIPGAVVGTPGFMSPEQAAGRSADVGPASDVYGLGATLFCLLAGRPPFEERDLDRTLEQVRRGEFPHPRAIDPTIPRPLEAIVLKAMGVDPDKRYASARVLADDLEKWLADEPVSAWREPRSTRARRRLARHRTLVTTGVALALLALAGLGFFVVYQRRSNLMLETANRNLYAANQRGERAVADRGSRRPALARGRSISPSVSLNLDVKNRPELKPLRKELLQRRASFIDC